MRSERESLFRVGPFSNRLMIYWGAATIAFVLAAVLTPGVSGLFKTAPLSGGQWTLALGAAIMGTFWIEVWKRLART